MARLIDHVQSDRLTLRRWRASDVDALSGAITSSTDHLRPWMPWIEFEPVTRPDRLAWIAQVNEEWAGGGDVIFGIFLGDVVVGGSGLHRRSGPGILDIGYWVHVDHVRRGIASEAAATLTSAAFTVAGINAVEIHHDRNNVASGAVPVSLGYSFIAEAPRALTAPGECGIDCRWRVERDAWHAHRAG